jgi:hypothetical protein
MNGRALQRNEQAERELRNAGCFMGFLTSLRERITHHPSVRMDPIFGEMEQAGPGLWQTTDPVPMLPGMEGVSISVEGDDGPDGASHEAFEELCRRYDGLKTSAGPLLCKAAPRVRSKCLWEHAWLASVEIWREPGTGKPVFALEYQLDDDPDYAYIVRVENWRAVDVLVTG